MIRYTFAVILLFGLFLRLWRLDYGMELPYLAHTDEPTQYNPVVRIIKTGDLNPHFFNYPSLSIYLNAAVLYVGFSIGSFLGIFESLADLQPIRTLQMGVGLVGTPSMLLLGRATTAVMGTLTIALAFLLTQPLTRLKWTPVFAALLLAVSQAHVRLSHYMAVDVIATFFAVATVVCCTLALSKNDRRFLWAAAACGGLATSSKYNYGVLLISVGLICLLDTSASLGGKVKSLWISGILFCLAFVFTSPFVLLDFENASRGIYREIRHYSTGHLGVMGNSFVWYLTYLWDINAFYLLLGIPGTLLALWRNKRVALPMVAFAVIYFGLIGNQVVHFDRNVLPVMVLLIVGIGVMVDTLGDWIPSQLHPWRLGLDRFGTSPVLIGLVLIPLLPSLFLLPAILQPPSPSGKAMAQAWFAQAAETPYGKLYLSREQSPTLRIAAEAYTVYLDPEDYDVKYMTTVTDRGGPVDFIVAGYDIVMLGSGMFNRFYENPDTFNGQVDTYNQFFGEVPDVLAFENDHNPLEFLPGGSNVYVFFLTGRARRLKAEVDEADLCLTEQRTQMWNGLMR